VLFRWTAATGMIAIPPPVGYHDPYPTQGHGLSADGSLIVGFLTDADNVDHAFVYRYCVHQITDSELVLATRSGFVDFTVEANRRLFISPEGTPQWMGVSGELPLIGTPPVYLTTQGPPLAFTANNGSGGAFLASGEIDPHDGPGCSDYILTEGSGMATAAEWRLSVSDDGGRTWSPLVKPRSVGKEGYYLTRLRWQKMGQARERMIRLESTDSMRRNIVGVYVDTSEGMG
jgi:uncharacterized membrane protein